MYPDSVLIDTHCHIDVEEFEPDRGAVIARARAAGVEAMVVPAVAASGWEKIAAICDREEGLHPAFGMHPIYLDAHRPAHLERLKRLVAERRPIAIGEIGLDYFIPQPDRAAQQELFEAQLRIARDADLPVILHLRRAIDQVLATLRRIRPKGGIAHAFNGSRQQADQFIGLGFRLGFGGVVTFERALRIRRLAAELPLEAMVLETDAPDLPPATRHGERNSPEYLPEVARCVAALRGLPVAEVAARTSANARETLGIA